MTDKAFTPEEASDEDLARILAVAFYDAINGLTANELKGLIEQLEERLDEINSGAYNGA